MSAAHQHGIIHRDLSPDNILIPGGDVRQAKIIDFGIARSTRNNDGTIIGSGFAGKYNYVSPEQLGLFSGDVTAKSDIYSLGLVIAECIAGRAIDMGGSQFDVLEKRRKVPDLAAIDSRLRPLIDRMLQPDPNDRPDSMATIAAWRPRASSLAEPPPADRPATRRAIAALAAVVMLFLVGGAYYLFGGSWSTSPGKSVALNAPTLNPDAGVDARRAEEARRVAAENLAKQRAEEAKQLADAKTNNDAGKASTAAPPRSDLVERIRQFVRSYDGGDCFFVEPVTIAENNATLEGYGRSATPFTALDTEFKRTNGFEASVGYHVVSQPQCAAITFLSRLRKPRDSALRLDVSAGNLRSNGYVNGSVVDFANRNVELLMVDHEGNVLALTSLLKGDGDPKSFVINLQRGDAGPARLQLLVALVSGRPLETLKARQPGSLELGTADEVFARVADEARKSAQSIDARIKSFNLEK